MCPTRAGVVHEVSVPRVTASPRALARSGSRQPAAGKGGWAGADNNQRWSAASHHHLTPAMADVSVAPATPPPAPPSVIGVEKSEKKKKKSSKDGRSKTAEERKKKKSASGDEPRRKKKSKKISSTPESDGSPNQEADLGTADGPHALTQEPDTSDGDLKFHDLDEAEDSESEPDHELDLSVPSTRRQSVQSHHRNASNGSRRSYQAPNDPQIEESVRKLSSGASLNVTTLRRSPSGRVRHSVRTSVGSRRSMGLVLEGEQAEHLASVPDLPPREGGQEEQEPHTHSDPAYKSSPRPQNRARIIDLDAGRPASWRDTPAAQSAPKSDGEGEEEDEENEVPPIGPGPGADPTGSKKSLWSTGAVRLAGVSAAVGGGASSLTSNLGRSLAAGIAAVRGPTPDGREERERVRLPRREVNEDQLAEDIMRFAEARHILRTENNAEKLRELGLRLEQAWREKVSVSMHGWLCLILTRPFSLPRCKACVHSWRRRKMYWATWKTRTSTCATSWDCLASRSLLAKRPSKSSKA